MPVDIYLGGTVFDPRVDSVFVENNKTNAVSVVDTVGFEETTRFDVGIHATSMPTVRTERRYLSDFLQ